MFGRSNTRNTLIIIGIMTILLLLLFFFVYFFIRWSNQKVASVSDELRASAAKQVRDQAMEKILADTVTERKRIDSYILSKDGAVPFIDEIENLGRLAGVELVVNSVSTKEADPKQKKQWEYFVLSISTEGRWINNFNFLSLLENLPYQAQIKKVLVERDQNQDKKNTDEIWKGEYMIMVLKFK